MLSLIGLGLGDERDITVKGLETVRKADLVYLEQYTSVLGVEKERLEEFYGRPVMIATRDLVEKEAETKLIAPARETHVAFLVVGDPFGATTHTDLVLRAREAGVPVEVIHNASIMNAVGAVGLELYKYGKTTSIPFPEEGYEPDTPYDVIKENIARGLHTLCLLDIKVAEPDKESLRQGDRRAAPPRFMTVAQAIDVLRAIEARRGEHVISETMLAIGVARLGQDAQIVCGPIAAVAAADLGRPLHALIIPGKLHVVEEEALATATYRLP